MTKNISILVAEDQGMLLGALSALLNLEGDFEVIAQANDGAQAIALLGKHTPDIVLTDIEMPYKTGLDLAKYVQENGLKTKVIVLTTFARSGYLQRAMKFGVKGYLLKDAPSDELSAAIRKVHAGKKVIAPELIDVAWDVEDPLTEKERKALKLAADGLSTEKIADTMFLSAGTVRNYLSSASSKLNAHNRIEAARIARQRGWL
uniref:response regulator transcription factor n=1 Tax=Ningiella ruwaisensis TaxID=2364274 RepID=UPI0010A037BF|nr:response regulator transcription factor [Ningiella ruwaisensis]